MAWQRTETLLEDGWYWRKASMDDPEPDCVEVSNGVYEDKEPADSHGAEWRVVECDDFSDWWWYGPIEVPK